MNYRIRANMFFVDQVVAESVNKFLKEQLPKMTSINEDRFAPEISFVDYEICGHDESEECNRIERYEVHNGAIQCVINSGG